MIILIKKVIKWYKGTTLFMKINNKKNGVTILSEWEYDYLRLTGKLKGVIVIQ